MLTRHFTLSVLGACLSALTLSTMVSAKPVNVIYMIGDGMGPAYTTAYRYYQDDPATPVVERTVFDDILVGMAATYPDDDTYVTDSAASATALATGIKSYNGAIAVDTKKAPLPTMLEAAKAQGRKTALVATSQINHATPASFAAHNESRRNYNAIADDYIDNKINGALPVDLMLGGGTDYFIRDDRNLVAEFKKANYQYIDDLNALDSLTRLPAMGLFAGSGMPYAIDSDPERLSKMTKTALSLLTPHQEQGFFIMIEGSQIDWCGHANDIACAMREMDDFAKAIALAKDFVDANPNTLLVVTADHSTGGLTLGRDGDYLWHPDKVKAMRVSASKMTKLLKDSDNIKATWQKHSDLSLTEADVIALKTAQQDDNALNLAIKDIVNRQSYSGFTTTGHTAIDVPVLAYGQGREHFIGGLNNTDIAKAINRILLQK